MNHNIDFIDYKIPLHLILLQSMLWQSSFTSYYISHIYRKYSKEMLKVLIASTNIQLLTKFVLFTKYSLFTIAITRGKLYYSYRPLDIIGVLHTFEGGGFCEEITRTGPLHHFLLLSLTKHIIIGATVFTFSVCVLTPQSGPSKPAPATCRKY